MKIVSTNLQDTEMAAQRFFNVIASSQNQTDALLIGLYGDLGSGKTTFTKSIAGLFNITDEVTSPTFVIEKIYPIDHPRFKRLIHIDAYRLASSGELYALGWQNMMANPSNIIFIEWPERVIDILPQDHKKILFTLLPDHTREIEF